MSRLKWRDWISRTMMKISNEPSTKEKSFISIISDGSCGRWNSLVRSTSSWTATWRTWSRCWGRPRTWAWWRPTTTISSPTSTSTWWTWRSSSMVAPTSLPSDLWIRTETMYRYYLVLGLSCNSVCVSKVIKEEDSCGLKTFKLLIYV